MTSSSVFQFVELICSWSFLALSRALPTNNNPLPLFGIRISINSFGSEEEFGTSNFDIEVRLVDSKVEDEIFDELVLALEWLFVDENVVDLLLLFELFGLVWGANFFLSKKKKNKFKKLGLIFKREKKNEWMN